MVRKPQLVFGTEKQLVFKNSVEFYISLGMVCNPNIFTISYEMNKRTGSYSNAYRLRKKKSCNVTLTNALQNALRSEDRINCNEYLEYLIDNYNIVEKSGDIICNIEEIIKSLPTPYATLFVKGYNSYKCIHDNDTKKISYTVDAYLNLANELVETEIPSPSTQKRKAYKAKNQSIKPKNKRDYLLQEIANSYIGEFGEEIVFSLECAKLSGKNDKPDWVAQKDDSLGYDIESYDLSGNKIYIEVKSTPYGPKTPFHMSQKEIDTSIKYGNSYYIYRVYNLKKGSDKYYYFIIRGDVTKNSRLNIVSEDSLIIIS